MTDTTAGAVELPLWPDDWVTEPCADSEADTEVRPEPIAYRGTEEVNVGEYL